MQIADIVIAGAGAGSGLRRRKPRPFARALPSDWPYAA